LQITINKIKITTNCGIKSQVVGHISSQSPENPPFYLHCGKAGVLAAVGFGGVDGLLYYGWALRLKI